jgi:hypothetical protein
MMSEWRQNALPQTKLSGSNSTEILLERHCHVRAFCLSTAPGIRRPTRAKSVIGMSGGRTGIAQKVVIQDEHDNAEQLLGAERKAGYRSHPAGAEQFRQLADRFVAHRHEIDGLPPRGRFLGAAGRQSSTPIVTTPPCVQLGPIGHYRTSFSHALAKAVFRLVGKVAAGLRDTQLRDTDALNCPAPKIFSCG